jgi:hypothetical protein
MWPCGVAAASRRRSDPRLSRVGGASTDALNILCKTGLTVEITWLVTLFHRACLNPGDNLTVTR